MHHLFSNNLDQILSHAVFFEHYFGADVISQVSRNPSNFQRWSEESKKTLRALCTFYANHLPKADHVIREDVDTRGHAPAAIPGELLIYFGVQLPRNGIRRQFVGVNCESNDDDVSFHLFIGGSPNIENRAQLIEAEDPTRVVENAVIRTITDLTRLQSHLLSVINRQKPIIDFVKTENEFGFSPIFCQKSWQGDMPKANAAEMLTAYWGNISRDWDPSKRNSYRARLTENNGYRKGLIISLIQQYFEPEEAFAVGLSAPA